MKKVILLLLGMFMFTGAALAETIDFEDLTLGPESAWNGSDGSGGFQSGFAFFENNYNDEWGTWDGFAYSNKTDTEAEGMDAQYNAITGGGQGGSQIYAIVFWSSFAGINPAVTFDEAQEITGAYFTNNNYTYYSMLKGDAFSKKFDNDDWLKVTVTGFDADGVETGDLEFYLAQNGEIVDDWKWVDFSVLGAVKTIEFEMSSTDVGDWGMNTPAYFAMDGLNASSTDDDDPTDGDSSSSSSSTCFIRTAGFGLFKGAGR
jgi:hypothetical protein